MPNVVGAIRNLCQNSPLNKDAVREAGGIAGLVDLLKAGHESPAATKAAETLEVVLEVRPLRAQAKPWACMCMWACGWACTPCMCTCDTMHAPCLAGMRGQ